MSCLYCGKDIPPFRLLRDDDFCSSDHRELHTARLRKALISLAEPDPPPAGIAGFRRAMPLLGARARAITIDSFSHPDYAPYHPEANRIPALPAWRDSFSGFPLQPAVRPPAANSIAGWYVPDSMCALPDSVRLRAIDGLGELDAGGMAPVSLETAAAVLSTPIIAGAPVHRGEVATQPPAVSAPAPSEPVFGAFPEPVAPAAPVFAAIAPVPVEAGGGVSLPASDMKLSAKDGRPELVASGIMGITPNAIPGCSTPAPPSIEPAELASAAPAMGSTAVTIDASALPVSAGPARISVDAASGTTTLSSPAGPLSFDAAIGRPAFCLRAVDLRCAPALPDAVPYPMTPARAAGETIASIEPLEPGVAIGVPPGPDLSGPLPALAGPASVRFEVAAASTPICATSGIAVEPSIVLPGCTLQVGGETRPVAETPHTSDVEPGDMVRAEVAVECAGPVLFAVREATGNRAPISAISPIMVDSAVGLPASVSLEQNSELALAAAVPAGLQPVAPAARVLFSSTVPAKAAGSAIRLPEPDRIRAAGSTYSPAFAVAAPILPEPAQVRHRPASASPAPIELDPPVRLSLRAGAGEIRDLQCAPAPAKPLDLIPAPVEGATGGGLLTSCATGSVSLPELNFGLAQPPVDYAADLSPAAVAVDALPSAARPTLRIAGTSLPQFVAPAPAVLATAPVVHDAPRRLVDNPPAPPPEVKLAPAAPELPAACQPAALAPANTAGLEFVSSASAILPDAPVEPSAAPVPHVAGPVAVEFYIQSGRLTPTRREAWTLPRPDALLPRMSINAVSTPPDELLERLQPGKDKLRVMPANGRSDTVHWAKSLAAGIAVCAFVWFGSLALRTGNGESTETPSTTPADSIALTSPPPPQGNGVLSDLRRTIAKRAKLEVSNDFRSGKDFWDGSRAAWGKGWERHSDGYATPGALALLRPTIQLADYRMEFMAQIENKSMSWVVRAHDTDNYYAMKLNVVTPGLRPIISVVRYHVVNGKRGRRVEIPLPVMMHNQKPHRVAVDVRGNRVVTSVEGEQVDSWVDDTLATGGVGFFSEGAERARLYWVRVTNNDDLLGRICAYLAGRPRNGTESAFNSGSGPDGRSGRGTPVPVAALPAGNELRRSRNARVRTQIG